MIEEEGPLPEEIVDAVGNALAARGGERKLPPRRLGLWLLAPLAASLVVLFVFTLEWKETLKIRAFDVSGTRIVPRAALVAMAKSGVAKSGSMYGTNIGSIQQKIAEQPFVKTAVVTRRMPDVLAIRITERDPIASLNTGQQMCYIDSEGVLLPYIQSAAKMDLPVISGIGGLEAVHTGEIASTNEVYQAIEILKTAQAIDSSLYRLVSEVNMNRGGDVTLYSADAGVPIILGRGDVARKLITLQSFWNTVMKSQDPKKLRSIDLRFAEQVVIRWDRQTERLPKKALL